MSHLLGWAARPAEAWSLRQNSGCGRLQICVFFAAFCRSLPSEVLDLLDCPEWSKKFETRHPPHANAKRCYQSGVSEFQASKKV
jgi:hypothetical protein